MALITCPDCGKDISENSQQCIHCGAPISGSPKDATSGVSGGKLFAIIAVGVAVGIFAWQFLIQSPAIVSEFKEGYQEQKALSTLVERGVEWKESNIEEWERYAELRRKFQQVQGASPTEFPSDYAECVRLGEYLTASAKEYDILSLFNVRDFLSSCL